MTGTGAGSRPKGKPSTMRRNDLCKPTAPFTLHVMINKACVHEHRNRGWEQTTGHPVKQSEDYTYGLYTNVLHKLEVVGSTLHVKAVCS